MLIRVTEQSLDPVEATEAVGRPEAGAVTLFLGVVRNTNLGRNVHYLVYDAYPSMAEKVMREIGAEACERFGLLDCAILHRTGRLEIGETSLLIAVSSGHRAAAFEGGHWLVDEIKKRVPVWKKEVWEDGEEWVEGPESLGVQQAPASMAPSVTA
jgi:molybdopterin synthase catalytic subunit